MNILQYQEKAKFLEKFGFSFLTNRKLSGDENLWCREYESGELDNPESFCLNESLYKWSVKSKYNHKDRIGSSGVGRYAGLEHLPNQEKVLEIREMPAASILLNSFKHLEMAILTTPLIMEKSRMGQIWTQEVVEGRWYDELATSSLAFIRDISKRISGSVTYDITCGKYFPISIIVDHPLYIKDRDSWEIKKSHNESRRQITVN